jgi:hypothetical protein
MTFWINCALGIVGNSSLKRLKREGKHIKKGWEWSPHPPQVFIKSTPQDSITFAEILVASLVAMSFENERPIGRMSVLVSSS